MQQPDPIAERQRLAENYSKMYDDELINLAIDAADLTPTAQEVLRQEMRNRGLGEPEQAIKARTLPEPRLERRAPLLGNQGGASQLVLDARGAQEAGDEPLEYADYTWKTPLCECDTVEQARQLTEVLRQAGIESWIEGPGTHSRYSGTSVTHIRIVVAADQLEQARQIAAQPIPEKIVEESQMVVPEFQPPVCPHCGAPDPALEGVDPFNSWRCEACGCQWAESDAQLGEDTPKQP